MKGAEAVAERAGLLQQLRVALEEALRPHGFVRAMPTREIDGVTFDDWTRDCGWKTDKLSLSLRGSSPSTVTAGVSVCISAAGPGRATDIDGVTVGFLSGRDPSYEIPRGLFLGTKEKRFVETIASDSVKALAWFEQYATPERCLARLDQEDRNGPRKGSPAHDRAVAFLKGLRR